MSMNDVKTKYIHAHAYLRETAESGSLYQIAWFQSCSQPTRGWKETTSDNQYHSICSCIQLL